MTEYERLFAAIDAKNEEYIHVWEDIGNIESPTLSKEGVDRVGAYCMEKAKALGFAVEVQKQEISGDCVMITMNPEAPGAPVCFSGHMDTVHPVGSFGTPAVRIADGKIYGPGVLDCKGGIVSSMLAMAALKEIGFIARPIKLFLQSDEENSSATSGKTTIAWICEKAKGSAAFLNGESFRVNKNVAVLKRKGILRYRFTVTGKAVHSSKCEEGVSAIREAAYKIIELEKLKGEGGLTCNCGLISGGTAENTVSESCTFYADFRYPNAEMREKAMNLAKSVAETSFVEGSSCELTLKSERVAMEATEKNLELLSRMNAIYRETGLPELVADESSGGSDAADVTMAGIPCVDNLGAAGEAIHSIRECALLSSLADSAKRLGVVALMLQ